MNIRDISKPVTAQSLNESLEKKFGKRVKLETFTLEQLHNSRNKLRTALSQIETNESYGAVNTSETYQKNKLFLDVLNAEISERETVEEGHAKEIMHRKAEREDREEFVADAGEMGMTAEEAGEFWDTTNGANESFDNVPPEDENDLDYEGGMAHKQLSTIDDAADELTDLIKTDENLPEWVQKKIILAMSYIDTARDYMKSAGAVDRERSMSIESVIREGAEDQAELVMAAKNMVDKLTGWMEDTAEMQTETMLELGDAIRDELGENESEQFTSTVKPSLESLYTAMESTRSDLVTGVRMVAGEEVPDMPGDDMDADLDMEPTVDQEDGDIDTDLAIDEPEDDFAAADAAAGGDEEAGREKRESIERPRRLAKLFASKKK